MFGSSFLSYPHIFNRPWRKAMVLSNSLPPFSGVLCYCWFSTPVNKFGHRTKLASNALCFIFIQFVLFLTNFRFLFFLGIKAMLLHLSKPISNPNFLTHYVTWLLMGTWQGGKAHIKHKHLAETTPLPPTKKYIFYIKKSMFEIFLKIQQ